MVGNNKNNAGYEKHDVNIFMVIGFSVVLVVLLIVILVFLIDYFVETKEQMIYEAQLQPESVDLKSLLEAEKKELTSLRLGQSWHQPPLHMTSGIRLLAIPARMRSLNISLRMILDALSKHI